LAGKFNDEKLRLQALRLSDPYDQPDLAFTVQADTKLLDIINIYSFEQYPAKKAFCVLCQGHHHKRGFTALLANGSRAMYGSTCGERAFGESWAEAENRIKDRADRQFELKKLDRLSQCIRSFEGLATWERAAESLDFRRAAFDRQLGELASRAAEAARHKHGSLTVFRAIESRAAKSIGKKETVTEEVTIGELRGRDFLLAENFSRSVSFMREALAEMSQGLCGSDGIPTNVLTFRRKKLQRSFDGVEEFARAHDASHEFWTIANFRSLVRWSEETIPTRYLIEDGIVRREDRTGGLRIELPISALDLSLLGAISDFRRSD
jgi:hypothetical protein